MSLCKTVVLQLAAVMMLAWGNLAAAFDPFTIKDIRVEGIQYTEVGTIFNYVPLKVGDRLTERGAAHAIKTLFNTGLFKDVQFRADGNVLVIQLVEQPAIASVDFSGLKALDKKAVSGALQSIDLVEGRILNRASLRKAEQEMKHQYLSLGHYAAEVNTVLTPLERNRVGVLFDINEGEKARIKEIRILGVKSFDESDLLDFFQLTTSGFFTWLTDSDQYSKQKLEGDLEKLRSYYLDRGYIDFTINDPQVSITPDKSDIYISIPVTEGEVYTVSTVSLAGHLMNKKEKWDKLILVEPGEIYSRKDLAASTQAITDDLADQGYLFANVNAVPEVDKVNNQVALTLYVEPGRRIYVRRIDIIGNTKTRDAVIRREIRQIEGTWYEGQKVKRSKERLDLLGYFESVTIETLPVKGAKDQVDLRFRVKETYTGSISAGIGYSNSQKLSFNASVSQRNLFGSGNDIKLNFDSKRLTRTYSLFFSDPYITRDGVSRSINLYHRTRRSEDSARARTDSVSVGGGVSYGIPLNEYDRINVGLNYDKTELTTFYNTPARWQNYIDQFGNKPDKVVATLGWSKSTVDSRLFPTRGRLLSLKGEVGLPLGDLLYYKILGTAKQFIPLSEDGRHALMLGTELGYARGIGSRELPFTENFYAGGIDSVRGYRAFSLGPVDAGSGGRLGGGQRVLATVEYFFPTPGTSYDRSARFSLFVDAGQVWEEKASINWDQMRYSAGFAMNWITPIGPLRFSYGIPLNDVDGDDVEKFQFTVGTTF